MCFEDVFSDFYLIYALNCGVFLELLDTHAYSRGLFQCLYEM